MRSTTRNSPVYRPIELLSLPALGKLDELDDMDTGLTSRWRRAGADWRGILRPALTPSQATPNLASIPRLALRVNHDGQADSAYSAMALLSPELVAIWLPLAST